MRRSLIGFFVLALVVGACSACKATDANLSPSYRPTEGTDAALSTPVVFELPRCVDCPTSPPTCYDNNAFSDPLPWAFNLPAYPNAQEISETASGDRESDLNISEETTFVTLDAPDVVTRYYQENLQLSGWQMFILRSPRADTTMWCTFMYKTSSSSTPIRTELTLVTIVDKGLTKVRLTQMLIQRDELG